MRFFVSFTSLPILFTVAWLSKDVTHATSIDAVPQSPISEYGPDVVLENETHISLSNGNELENDRFTRMPRGEFLVRTKRQKHSRHHHHSSCSKRKKHHGHCDRHRNDRHHKKKNHRHQQPVIDHTKATTPDYSKPGHTIEPEQSPNHGRTVAPEQFPNRPGNDRGGSWTNEETVIDEWSINRRKENRRKTQYSENQNS